MRYWLSRAAFALFAVAFVLLWTGYQGSLRGQPLWKTTLQFTGAIVCTALAAWGVRERHRGDDQQGDQ